MKNVKDDSGKKKESIIEGDKCKNPAGYTIE